MVKIFCYGTLKRGQWNNNYLNGCEFLGEAVSADANYTMTGRGVPFLHDGGDQFVKGELWEVTDEALPGIDRLEGHPNHYCRQERWFVKENGDRVLAWVYLVEKNHWAGALKYEGEVLEW